MFWYFPYRADVGQIYEWWPCNMLFKFFLGNIFFGPSCSAVVHMWSWHISLPCIQVQVDSTSKFSNGSWMQVPKIHCHTLSLLLASFRPLIQLFHWYVNTFTPSARTDLLTCTNDPGPLSSYRQPCSNPVLVTCCQCFGVRMWAKLILVPESGLLAPTYLPQTCSPPTHGTAPRIQK